MEYLTLIEGEKGGGGVNTISVSSSEAGVSGSKVICNDFWGGGRGESDLPNFMRENGLMVTFATNTFFSYLCYSHNICVMSQYTEPPNFITTSKHHAIGGSLARGSRA